MEVRNGFKELDLIDRVPEELWMGVHDAVQEAVIKTIPVERNAKKQNGCLKRPYKAVRSEKQRRKGKIFPFECRIPKDSKERLKKSLPQRSMQRNRGKQQNGKD